MTTVEVSEPQKSPRRRGFRPFRNPVVLKELRGRMRGARAFIVISVFLLLMSGFTTLLYVINERIRDNFGFTSGGVIGRTLFAGIVALELFLVTFIAPAFTAGAISGERERQTYDLLRTTLLPARSLVVGKMTSALSYIFLLLLAAIPLQSVAFLFGGVTEAEIVLAFVILAVTAVALGAVGIYFSANTARTLTANVRTYGLALFIVVGVPLLAWIGLFLLTPWQSSGGFSNLPLGVQALLAYATLLVASTNPLMTAFYTQSTLLNQQATVVYTQTLTSSTQTGTMTITLVSPWVIYTVIYLLVSAILVVLAVRRTNKIDVQ